MIACVLLLPGSILTLGAGVVFGLVRGFVIVSISATLGATAAFLVGRYLVRDWIARKIEGHPKFKAIDEAVAGEGWKIVAPGACRPSCLQRAELRVRGHPGVAARLRARLVVGMMPGTLLYVYLGSSRAISRRGRPRARTPPTGRSTAWASSRRLRSPSIVTRLARRALAGASPT